MKNKIKKAIKKEFGTIENFCNSQNLKYKNFGSKLDTITNQLTKLNEFLNLVNLEIRIKKKRGI